MRSADGGLRRKFMENELITTRYRSNIATDEDKEANAIEWISFMRRNIEVYVEEILQIKLRPFQRVVIHLAGISDFFMMVCSRGLSKSWMCGVIAMAIADLYPYSEIIITSSTMAQSNKMAEKILNEIIKKNSPVLLYKYEHEYIVKTQRDDGYLIENKLNGSTIRTLPALDSARGARSTVLIFEEARLIKRNIIDQVFRPMAHPRQAKYLANPQYGTKNRWLEETKNIYLSSAGYKYEWMYNLWKKTFAGIFIDKKIHYNIFAGDIYTSMQNGLKTIGDYNRAIKTSTESAFKMEDLNEWLGGTDDAFFDIRHFKENQNIKQCFTPPTDMEYYLRTDLGNREKELNEVRLVIVDFAFANTTSSEKNDNTIIMCMSAHWHDNHYERWVEYIEGWSASDSIGAADRVMQLYWDYDADYLAMDGRSGGEVLFNHMTEKIEKPNTFGHWRSQGLTIANTPNYHVVPQAKLDDYRIRTVDPDAHPCIIPILGTGELNSFCWVGLRKQLECNNIKLLISMQDKQYELEDTGEYYQMSSEQFADKVAPHGQVDMMIQEAVNLSAEFKNDRVKLVEPRSGTKDRAVVLAYGNHIIDKIENDMCRMAQQAEYTLDDFDGVW